MKLRTILLSMALVLGMTSVAVAEDIGSVSTVFKILGANDKIIIEAFDDPDIEGVTCYLSRAKKGGVSGSLGLAEDTSDASVDCVQIGPINIPAHVRAGKEDGEAVFKKRTSLLFKTMQVVRFYDAKRNVLVYLSYSDRVVEGSPKNSISTVPVLPWGE